MRAQPSGPVRLPVIRRTGKAGEGEAPTEPGPCGTHDEVSTGVGHLGLDGLGLQAEDFIEDDQLRGCHCPTGEVHWRSLECGGGIPASSGNLSESRHPSAGGLDETKFDCLFRGGVRLPAPPLDDMANPTRECRIEWQRSREAAELQMRVRIHQSRQHEAIPEVDLLGLTLGPHSDDLSPHHRNPRALLPAPGAPNPAGSVGLRRNGGHGHGR